jgi:peptidoglycan hydrolase-like protein with peptidoglycan-binding domain
MKISERYNATHSLTTEHAESVEVSKAEIADSQSTPETQSAKTGQSSTSEATAKKAELAMSSQAQAASLQAKPNKSTEVRWEQDLYGGGYYPQLKKGDNNPVVLELQKGLNERRKLEGKPPIKEDGVYGKDTEFAVLEYQEDVRNKYNGNTDATGQYKFLDRPGVAGQSTWKSLGVIPRLGYGCKGDDVNSLQSGLNAYRESKGLPPIRVDGKYGPETEKAVKQYQKDKQLTVDGKAGVETMLSLKDDIAEPKKHETDHDVKDKETSHVVPSSEPQPAPLEHHPRPAITEDDSKQVQDLLRKFD